MEPIAVLSAPLTTDLSPLTRHLWARRIVHRVVEQRVTDQNGEQYDGQDPQQVLFIVNPADLAQIQILIEQWREGSLGEPEARVASKGPTLVDRFKLAPITALIVFVLIMIFGWQHISTDWHDWLTHSEPLWPSQRALLSTYLDMGFWELWRHTLLHFGAFHLISNLLWIWIFAGAMERVGERGAIIALLIFCGLAGNIFQWWLAGPAFGGASGFVYGLAAWTGLRQTRYKVPYGVPPAVLVIMVIFMLITITGETLSPGMTGVANGGHLGGLLCGFLMAILWPVSYRGKHDA